MRPRKPDGTQWSPIDSNAVLQHIGREITKETNIRDIARGCPDDGHGNAAACELRGETYVVNPHWARLKTPGSHWIAEIRRRWAEFCSEPRDPATELAKIGETPTPDETPRMNLQGLTPAITEAIRLGIAAGVESAMRLSQGNGRSEPPAGGKAPLAKSRTAEPRTVEATT